ncbi:hypothetical protein [Variovorax sp. E3]|jgi:uracil-DNA glycosylase|uniref:hypothetical protein n=1 Tax=Variovorax sp. E3 TaxID=1914993 RepID=UPI0018DB94C1|nr:hypothetical protein [Variovorax sp. E3]
MPFLLNALSVIRQELKAIVVLGAVAWGLYTVTTAVMAAMPDVRISISMGHGVLAPKLISFVGGLWVAPVSRKPATPSTHPL